MSFIGRQKNLLDETPEHVRQLKLRQPFLTPEDMDRLRLAGHPDVQVADLDMTFPADGGGESLERSLDDIFRKAEAAIAAGATILVLTDRAVGPLRAPIPALLAVAGLHHHLIRAGLRNHAGIILEGGEPREVMHFALLFGYGANATCPTTALATIRELAESGLLEVPATPAQALDNYITAVKKGLLKTMSRMGISTLRSFFGSQIFEAVGIGANVIERYFTGTPSRLGGIGLPEVAAEATRRHHCGWCESGCPGGLLDTGGDYHLRFDGERHTLRLEAISKLQEAVRRDDPAAFGDYVRIITAAGRHTTLRGQPRLRPRPPRAAGRGRARGGDLPTLRQRRDELRLDQPGGARGAGGRDEPHRRAQQLRRRGRGPGARRAPAQRRLAPLARAAGGLRAGSASRSSTCAAPTNCRSKSPRAPSPARAASSPATRSAATSPACATPRPT